MRRRIFSTNARDRIEFRTAEAGSSRSNVSLVMKVRVDSSLLRWDTEAQHVTVEALFTPKEATRFMELIEKVDADVWADEMGDCSKHELTPVRCDRCGRYCGTKRRCPHCDGKK
jgi:hypothetical protein